ncbi:response regulator transcription factor [Novosphingobium sp. P6W]|uniref:response regulator transcription factor n=1 Tax=Novosphingobium sp. P6W TaxID=1609758 RepID=UPI0005C2F6F9|nr:response regulator [Novosphingobium sp. P6W]AXB76657.1 DNA-binding response regulator [Novosphingobium sp. P6W]KIS33482.1 Nodulation protein W [Novosphingobium sp. P6W]
MTNATENYPDSGAPTVHVIDDDPCIREALDGLFRAVGYPVRTFGATVDFVASGHHHSCGCLVLDVFLSGLNGLDFLAQFAGKAASMPVILMTGRADIPMAVRGVKAGAIDFLPKPFAVRDMLDAVASAMAKDAAQRAERARSQQLYDRMATLTGREKEVMSLVAKGKMNKQVAFEIGLSEVTVKIYRGKAMRKMGARTLADFVLMADRLDLRGGSPPPDCA